MYTQSVAWLVLVAPMLGTLGALFQLYDSPLAARDIVLLAIFYTATMFGITAGYHRLFTHRGYNARPAARAVLAVLGSMALQGPVVRWVAHHRRHHDHSDDEGDPHSPRGGAAGMGSALRGLMHAHVGWMLGHEEVMARKYTPDLLGDRLILRIDALYPVWMILSLALPAALGGALGGASQRSCGRVS